jgi:hypothetical protein
VKISEYAKAVSGGVVAFLGAFDLATSIGSIGGETVTGNEWVRIVVVTIAAAAAVFLTSNALPAAKKTTATLEVTEAAPESYVGDHAAR